MVTVDTDGDAVQTLEPEMVELTIRVPEQFFTRKFWRSDWEDALEAKAAQDALPPGGVLELGDLWSLPEYMLDHWASNLEIEDELYGPDGQQIW